MTNRKLVYADDAKRHIKDYGKGAIACGIKTLDPVDDIVAIAGIVDCMPAVDAAPVIHGHWIDHALGFLLSHTTCSRCGFNKDGLSHPNYCEECGAKMDEEVSDGKTNEDL